MRDLALLSTSQDASEDHARRWDTVGDNLAAGRTADGNGSALDVVDAVVVVLGWHAGGPVGGHGDVGAAAVFFDFVACDGAADCAGYANDGGDDGWWGGASLEEGGCGSEGDGHGGVGRHFWSDDCKVS